MEWLCYIIGTLQSNCGKKLLHEEAFGLHSSFHYVMITLWNSYDGICVTMILRYHIDTLFGACPLSEHVLVFAYMYSCHKTSTNIDFNNAIRGYKLLEIAHVPQMHHKVSAFHYVWHNFVLNYMSLKTVLPVKYLLIYDCKIWTIWSIWTELHVPIYGDKCRFSNFKRWVFCNRLMHQKVQLYSIWNVYWMNGYIIGAWIVDEWILQVIQKFFVD